MDWRECIKQRIVRSVKKDRNLITSTREIAEIKIESAEVLPGVYFIAKISLLYDALREYLESVALERFTRYTTMNAIQRFLRRFSTCQMRLICLISCAE
jgi:hypothetical protein